MTELQPRLRYYDRAFVVGYTGSGKSELLNTLFTECTGVQRVLVDTKDEFSIPDVDPVRGEPSAIDWSEPVIHYRDGGGGPDEFERLFASFNERHHILVCVHELADLCDHSANRAPAAVKDYLKKGRAHGRGLLGGTQRPVEMPRAARSEAQHVFYFVPPLDDEDHKIVAGMTQRDATVLAEELELARGLAQDGRYAYLWYDRENRQLLRCPPLPEHMRKRTIVHRTTVV